MSWFGGDVQVLIDRVPGDHEDLVVGANVVALTAAKINPTSGRFAGGAGAKGALITAEGGDMRYWIDGAIPTITSGHFMGAGDTRIIPGNQILSQFRIVRIGDTDGVLRVTYLY